jgi:ATP-binding cassette subfamily B protein
MVAIKMITSSQNLQIKTWPKQLGSLRLIWDLATNHPFRIAAALAALIVSSLATLAIPLTFKEVIDRGFGGASTLTSIDLAFRHLLFLVLGLAIATACRSYFVSWLGERVVADLRRKVQAHLLRLAPRFFEENRPSEISSRMTNDTMVIEQIVTAAISIALRNIFSCVGGTIYLFVLEPKLAAYFLLCVPLIVAPLIMMGRRLQWLSRSSQDKIATVGAIVSETLAALKIVQAFNQEEREEERFALAVESVFLMGRRRAAMGAIMGTAVTGLIFGAVTIVLWVGAYDVAAGEISGGTIAAFVLTGGVVTNSFSSLTDVYADLVRAAGAAARLTELLAETSEITVPAHPQALPTPPRGMFAFDQVEFCYPTRPDVSALHNFSLTVFPGETVAVVGHSGAGKTTLFQLAQRFYDPQAGTVRLDGIAMTQLDLTALRQQFAVVPQEAVIFAASARDNIRYGRWDASDPEIWAAAEAANATQFLEELPHGLDTFLGESGTRLSGGQRQRIAIARAVLRNAPILLLDEATSALDAESEMLVQDALERLAAGRTTVVIAHRLATVRSADRIIVMDRGRIVEEGRHDELVSKAGLYARLARLQFDGERG